MHGSIGPSCAIASVDAEGATLWSPTQSSFNLRDAVAVVLGMPRDKVRLVWVEGSGCYGHNGADDVTADAALMSQIVGRPVRVQWMRHDEHGNEPKGAAMVMEVAGGLDAQGNVAAWDYQVWSPGHAGRPAGNRAGQHARRCRARSAGPARADRRRPQRTSDLRLPEQPREAAPAAIRRAARVVAARPGLAAEYLRERVLHRRAGRRRGRRSDRVSHPAPEGRACDRGAGGGREARPAGIPGPRRALRDAGSNDGRGVAFVHYDNYSGYAAIALQVRVDRASGKVSVERAAAAHDCGLIVNPDGLKNQIEGNIVQTLSRALLEYVRFDTAKITSLDWTGYPILRLLGRTRGDRDRAHQPAGQAFGRRRRARGVARHGGGRERHLRRDRRAAAQRAFHG